MLLTAAGVVVLSSCALSLSIMLPIPTLLPVSLSLSVSLALSLPLSSCVCVCLLWVLSVFHPFSSIYVSLCSPLNYCVPDVLFLKRMTDIIINIILDVMNTIMLQYVLSWLCMFTFPCCLKLLHLGNYYFFIFEGYREVEGTGKKMKENID